jgi:hypothetical protein
MLNDYYDDHTWHPVDAQADLRGMSNAAGITDEHKTPLIVDWRSPVAETYYNQEMGQTSYLVDGKLRTVNLELRRQFDITRDKLNMYFDTTVAIEDSLLLGALKRHHSEKLQAITATIQREQNQVVRHDDVPALLVNGIAGSGKTSVMLQRIAFLLYRQRETLSPSQVYLFTPNSVFESYIDHVLPSLGEANPQTFTWASFMEQQGLSERSDGAATSPDELRRLESLLPSLVLEEDDLRGEGSYPSGHSLRGWGIALLLAQIAPERANEIFKRGWDYCNSRVIVGAHWQSDVDASRAAASIGFCALQGSPEFRAQMEKAQEEYAVKTGQTVGVEKVAAAAQAPTQYIFRVDGSRTTEQTRGIKVQNGRKYATQ